MGANYLIIAIGLIICFGGIYFRRVCAGIMGLVWGVLGTVLLLLLFALGGDLDVEEGTAIFLIVVGGLLFASLSAIYYKICALINGFSFGFTGLLLILLFSDNLDSLEAVIIIALLAGVALAFVSYKYYDHSFVLLTAFTGAFIASLGVYAIMHKESFDELAFEAIWRGLDGLSIVYGGTFVLGCIGVFVQYQRLGVVLGESQSNNTENRGFDSVIGTVENATKTNGGTALGWKQSADSMTTDETVDNSAKGSLTTLSLVSTNDKDKFLFLLPVAAYILIPILSRFVYANFDYYESGTFLTIYNYFSLILNYAAVGCIVFITIAKSKKYTLVYLSIYVVLMLIYNFSYIKYYNFIQLVLSFGKYVVLWGILVLANMAIKRVAIKPFLLAIITCLYENYLYYWIGAGDIYFFFNSNVVISSAVIIGIVWLLFKIMVNFNIFALSTPNETYTPSPNT